jgi:hypothetical protein
MKTVLILTVEHPKPLPDLTDLIAGRVWSIQGVEMAEARLISDIASEMIPEARANVVKLAIANG